MATQDARSGKQRTIAADQEQEPEFKQKMGGCEFLLTSALALLNITTYVTCFQESNCPTQVNAETKSGTKYSRKRKSG